MNNIVYRLKLMVHNVNGWTIKTYKLFNCYEDEDPDVILLSEHGISEENKMKLFGYEVLHVNPKQ